MAASNLIFQITNTGITAANNANQGGPKVNITSFKVGSAYNYSPATTDTALHGTTLYSGGIAGYAVDSNDAVTYTIQMDQTVGTFNFGEIGLYDSNGNLFALGALANLQEKVQASGSNPGNVVSFQIKLTLANIAPAIQFTQVTSTNAQLLEIAAPDGLPVPGPVSPNNPNVYSIQGGDDSGQPIIAVRETASGLWAFSTHPTQIFTGLVTSSSSTSAINCSSITSAAFDFKANRYIAQFTSGTNKGIARYVTGFSNGQFTVSGAFPAAPATNDNFTIYVSNYFRLSEYNFAVDSGTANSYLLTVYPAINAPAPGMVFTFVATNGNTGASTVNIAGTNYSLNGPAGALQGGEIVAGARIAIFFHSGACYLMTTSSGAVQVGPASKSEHALQLGQVQSGALALNVASITAGTGTFTNGSYNTLTVGNGTFSSGTYNGLLTIAAGGIVINSGGLTVNNNLGATISGGLSVLNGSGVSTLYTDSNINDLVVRTGASSSYNYTVFDANGNLLIPGYVQGANAAASNQAVMLGQLQSSVLSINVANIGVSGTVTATNITVNTGGLTVTGTGINVGSGGLSISNGSGSAFLQPDANTNDLAIRTGPSSAYKTSTFDANGNLLIPGYLQGARATTSSQAVMLGQLTDNSQHLYVGGLQSLSAIIAPAFTGLASQASTLSQNGGGGAAMTFNWSGQNGQPQWLWGSNNGTDIYVYNPSNFSVNYANTVGGASFPASFGGNGYQKLPNGWIIQWGSGGAMPANGASANYYFPIGFPNACLMVVPAPNWAWTNNGIHTGWTVNGFNASYFAMSVNSDSYVYSVYYLAVGY